MAAGAAGKRIATLLVFALLLAVFVVAFGRLLTPPAQVQPAPSTAKVTKAPARIALRNYFNGNAITGARLDIYLGSEMVDSGLTDASGVYMTSVPLAAGQTYTIKVSFGNTLAEYAWTPAEADYVEAYKAFTKVIKVKPAPSKLELSVVDKDYNKIVDGGSFNASGLTSAEFTVIVKNPEVDTGLAAFTSRITGRTYKVVMLIRVTGKAKLTSANLLYSFGTDDNVYMIELDAAKLDTYKDKSGNIVYGMLSYALRFDTTAMQKGDATSVTIMIYAYFDPAYYKEHGAQVNAEAIQLATFGFSIAK